MASNSSGLFLTADKRRKSTYEITIGEADGDDVSIADGDNVRIKIGRAGVAPQLEIESDEATANGSSCTRANPTELNLTAADLTFAPGVYDIEAAIVDASDGDAIKSASKGVFVLLESMLGNVD